MKLLIGIWCAIVLVVVLLVGIQVKLHKNLSTHHAEVVSLIGEPTQEDHMRFIRGQIRDK